jgi:alpha-L-fucosidase 2
MTARPLWERWEYTGDVDWLRRVYPFLRGAAVFYSAYMDKYFDSMGGIGPSMWLEGPGWQAGFAGNMNLAPDLIYFRKTLLWASEAAETLGQDSDRRDRWQANAARVPDIAYGTDDEGPWVERPGRCRARYIAAQEHVAGDEPDGLAAHMRAMTGDSAEQYAKACRHMFHDMLGLVRLQPPLAYEVFRKLMRDSRQPSGQTHVSGGLTPTHWRAPEDHWLATRGVAELLLQSQGGVLRLFPGWPPDRAARFAGLPARGGFLVDAEQDAYGRVSARIRSAIGRTCRLRWTRPQSLTVTCNDQAVPTTTADREIAFETEAGQVYCINIP